MELCKLAIWYVTRHIRAVQHVSTNLIGIQTTKQLEMNLDVLHNGITGEEKIVLEKIEQK